MKNRIYSVLTLLILSVFVIGCAPKKEAEHAQNSDVETEGHHEEVEEAMLTNQQFKALNMKTGVIELRTMSGYVEANGTLEVPPQNEAAVTSFIGANVVAIKVIEGDKVEKGQVLAYLSHPNIIQMQTDYLHAYTTSNFLKKNNDRQQKLVAAGAGSGANFQKAEADYRKSKALENGLKAQLQLLQINTATIRKGTLVKNIELRSPIDGFVQKVEIKTGQYVEPQTELFEIVNTHHVHADLMIFEKDVYKVKKGQKVNFNVQSFPDEELSAEIYSVSKTFESAPKAVHVHAEIENKKGHLIPGMYIKGKIQINNTKRKAIPESAIIKRGNQFFVFSVERENEDWSFKPIEVIVGEKDEAWLAIEFMEEIDETTMFAYNNAYYLLAQMEKGEAGHHH
ncbi:efflux RND transporter periplasmic adaptor subunit [Flavicella sediminum]|uniref:efflux RND transporter periplasmic adaptor subunit n=1 Tax=Flavicella sediminum TaxID=2585141 RepID=UPI001121D34B|nr:efflux RND transporter periplasmic adaptor subunit [Flavicella sediminum]